MPTKPSADKRRAEKVLLELLKIPGRSGREAQVMEYIADQLRHAGVADEALCFDSAHRRSPHGGQIGNLSLKLPGASRKPRRMLTAHVDTVPLCEGVRPIRRGNLIVPADKSTALGGDDRAGAAVVLLTALDVLRGKSDHPPLTFLWMVQEEVGLHGARNLRLGSLGKPRLVFNFDGGSPEKLTIGATGGYRMDIRVTGIAAHAGGAPEQGVSAIAIASLAIAELQRDGWHGLIQKGGRTGTSNIGMIHGGDATNVVTSLVELRGEARSHDPVFRGKIVKAIEAAFQKAAKSLKNLAGKRGSVKFDGRLDYEAFKLADEEACLLAAEQAVRDSGGQPLRAISNGGLDANWLTARSLPTVTLGCGQANIHTTAETLDLEEFHHACGIALRLANP